MATHIFKVFVIAIACIVDQATAKAYFSFRTKDLVGEAGWTSKSKDLLAPMVGCQFVLCTGISQSKMFTPLMLDAIDFLGRQSLQPFEITTSLQEYVHARYNLRHSHVRIVYLVFRASRPSSSVSSNNNVPLELNFPFFRSFRFRVRPNDDLILLFLDADRFWGQKWYMTGLDQCLAPSTLLVFVHRGMRLANEAFVMLTRRNREGKTGLYSASILGVNVFGSTFKDLHTKIRFVRGNFHGSLVYSKRRLCRRLIQGQQVDRDIVRECADRRANSYGMILWELAANLNVSIAYISRYTAFKSRCEKGTVDQQTAAHPRKPSDGLSYYPYNIQLMNYTSLRLIYVDDVTAPSFFSLRSTAAPFSYPLWLLLLAAICTLCAVGSVCLKAKGSRLGFIFCCLTTLICQVPCIFKRTALLALLWMLGGIVITNHYLALVQSLSIVQQVVLEQQSFLQLMGNGYKFYAHDQVHEFVKAYSNSVLQYTSYGMALWDDERMFILALERDRKANAGHLNNKTIAVEWENDLLYAAEIIKQNFSRNAHVLTREFMRTAIWYELNLPNSDVAMEKLHALVVSGIQSYWFVREMKKQTKDYAETLASVFRDIWYAPGGRGYVAADRYYMAFGRESLLLESFGLFVIGWCLSLAVLVQEVVCQVAHMVLESLYK